MGNLKKIVVVMLALVIVLGLLAACSKNNDGTAPVESANTDSNNDGNNETATETPAEKVTLTFVTPGSEPTEGQKRWDAINKKLADDGLNLEIKFTFIGWDAWEQKTNLMLSTNEAFDNITIMEDWIKSSVYAGRGAIVPIDEYLEKYPNLKAAFPDNVWENMRINGKIYAIPVFYREWANDYEEMSYRKDLLGKHGLPVPATVQEMIETADKIKKECNDPNLYIVQKPNNVMHMVHREYDSYPFNIIDDLIFVDQQGNVKSWLETPEFKQDSLYFRDMYKRGLIHPDILTLPLDQVTKPTTDGNALFAMGNVNENIVQIKAAKPEAEYEVLRFAPGKPKMRPLLGNANAIPKSSKNPESMIQFFDWLYSKQENYDLLVYGFEGDWFNDLGPGMMEKLRPVGTEVEFSEWKVGNYKYVRFSSNLHPSLIKSRKIDESVVNAINIGFVFDTEPVSVEYANLLAEIKTSVYPLKMGVAEFDDFYPQALNKMKSAGIDKVVAEYEKQFKAWMASK